MDKCQSDSWPVSFNLVLKSMYQIPDLHHIFIRKILSGGSCSYYRGETKSTSSLKT